MNRIHRSLFFLIVVLIWSTSGIETKAQYRSLGIGGMFGSPTGITIKKWMSRKSAFDLGLAWSLSRDPGVHLHGDILYHTSDFDGMEEGVSYVYLGLGGRIKAAPDDPRAGVRIPIGVTYINGDEPIDAFFELVPVVDMLPRTRLALNVSVGGRIYLSGNRSRY